MFIINQLLCVSTGAFLEKLDLHEFIDWIQTKGSLYSRQDLNHFSVETCPLVSQDEAKVYSQNASKGNATDILLQQK